MLCPPFDIHKSKLVIVERHFVKVGKTYNNLVFSDNLNNNSWRHCCLNVNTIFGHKYIIIFSTNYFPQIVKEDGFDN